MGRNRKPVPFQPLATELETVAAAMGVRATDVTTDALRGLQAALSHTASPLKDAVDHLMRVREITQRKIGLMKQYRNMLADVDMQMKTKSAMEPIDYHEAAEQEILDELRDVLFLLM